MKVHLRVSPILKPFSEFSEPEGKRLGVIFILFFAKKNRENVLSFESLHVQATLQTWATKEVTKGFVRQ